MPSDPFISAPAEPYGALPEWNLDDLYAGIDSPDLKRDFARADTDSVAFEARYKGKLAELAAGEAGGKRLAEAVSSFEALEDLLGRIISYAGLLHAGDTTDPARSKFYGDVQEKITAASSHLLFFQLELNRIGDDVLEAAMGEPSLAHYRPWLEDIRREKPYELEDRVEQLFHEKSVTGRGAWNRLFDETMASLRFEVDGETLAIEPTLNLLQDPDGAKRKAAAEALAVTFKDNLRLFTHITNTLAKDKEISDRWRGFKDVADPAISPTGSNPRSSMRWSRRSGRPIRASHTDTTRSRRNGSGAISSTIGIAMRRCRRCRPRRSVSTRRG